MAIRLNLSPYEEIKLRSAAEKSGQSLETFLAGIVRDEIILGLDNVFDDGYEAGENFCFSGELPRRTH